MMMRRLSAPASRSLVPSPWASNPWYSSRSELSLLDDPFFRDSDPFFRNARSMMDNMEREMHMEIQNMFNYSPIARSLFDTPIRSIINDPFNNSLALLDREAPGVDIQENANTTEYHLAVPGLSMDDLRVDLQGNQLTIAGHKEQHNDIRDINYIAHEDMSGDFQHSFTVPDGLQPSAIAANLHNGELVVTVPKPNIHAIQAPPLQPIAIQKDASDRYIEQAPAANQYIEQAPADRHIEQSADKIKEQVRN